MRFFKNQLQDCLDKAQNLAAELEERQRFGESYCVRYEYFLHIPDHKGEFPAIGMDFARCALWRNATEYERNYDKRGLLGPKENDEVIPLGKASGQLPEKMKYVETIEASTESMFRDFTDMTQWLISDNEDIE